MLEDINMLLNGADIPNLYPADEKALVIEKIQSWVAKNNMQVFTVYIFYYILIKLATRETLLLDVRRVTLN